MRKLGLFKIARQEEKPLAENVKIEYVDPIFGGKLNATQYYNLIIGLYNHSMSLLTPSELGCTLSHLSIYKRIVDAGVDAIVLESDVSISNESIAMIKDILDKNSCSFIHLGIHPDKEYQKSHLLKKTKIKFLYKISLHRPLFGTYAYFISKELAKELLLFHENLHRRADCWQEFFASKGELSTYYFPLVAHPKERGGIQLERLKLKSKSICHLSLTYVINRLRFFMLWVVAFLLGYRKIGTFKVIE